MTPIAALQGIGFLIDTARPGEETMLIMKIRALSERVLDESFNEIAKEDQETRDVCH